MRREFKQLCAKGNPFAADSSQMATEKTPRRLLLARSQELLTTMSVDDAAMELSEMRKISAPPRFTQPTGVKSGVSLL